MAEFNPEESAEMGGLRFENEALKKQLGLMEQEVLTLHQKVRLLFGGKCG